MLRVRVYLLGIQFWRYFVESRFWRLHCSGVYLMWICMGLWRRDVRRFALSHSHLLPLYIFCLFSFRKHYLMMTGAGLEIIFSYPSNICPIAIAFSIRHSFILPVRHNLTCETNGYGYYVLWMANDIGYVADLPLIITGI